MRHKTLPFAPQHIPAIRDGDKRLTFRWDLSTNFEQGEEIKFVDSSNNEIFGNGVVLDSYDITVDEIIVTYWEYHKNYRSLRWFNHSFSNYYDHEFRNFDILDVIEWGDTFTANRVYYNG